MKNALSSTIIPMLLLAVGGCADPCADDGLIQHGCSGQGAPPEADGGDGPFGDGAVFVAGTTDTGDDAVTSAATSASTESSVDGADATSSADGEGSSDGGPSDADQDGVPDEEDVCPSFADPAQLDGDGDGLGDVCDLDTECGVAMGFGPILEPEAVVAAGQEGPCVGCMVKDAELTADHDFTTHATIETPLAVLGRNFLHVRDSEEVHPAGTRVGFVVASGEGELDLEALWSVVLITTLGGQTQESSETGAEALDLLTSDDELGKALVVFETSEDYDGVRLELAGLANGLEQLDVYAACTETP